MSRAATRRTAVAALLGCALVTTACGSTVANNTAVGNPAGPQSGTLDGVGSGSGLSGTGPAGSTPLEGAAGAGAVPGSARSSGGGQVLPGAPATETGTGDGQSGARSTTAAVPTATGPGVTASTITIGALTANKAGEYQSKLGANKGAGATGDQIAMTNSVVNWLNKRGGIGGRNVKVIVYDIKPEAIAADPSSAYEAACTNFTQDNKVFAVLSLASLVPANFYACLRKQGVVVVPATDPRSSRFMREFDGTVYEPTNPNYTRLLAQSVDVLWAEGWLTASSKVGVVGYDTIDARATVTDGLVPALKRHGLTLTGKLYAPEDGSAGASAYASGVLQFKDSDIDRVFFAPGGQPFYFGAAADQQLYYPFYEISTLEYPSPIATYFASRPNVLKGSAGLGWHPYADLGYGSGSKVPPTPGKADCLEAIRDANQDLTEGTTFAIATWICDGWFFLRSVIARTPVINRTQFGAAAEGLGRSFRAASTFQTYFAPNRTSDGAAAYRLNKFNDACACYQYASAIRPLP